MVLSDVHISFCQFCAKDLDDFNFDPESDPILVNFEMVQTVLIVDYFLRQKGGFLNDPASKACGICATAKPESHFLFRNLSIVDEFE